MTATQTQSHIQSAGDNYRECNRKIDHLIEMIQMSDAWDNVDSFRELNQKLEVAVADARLALVDWDTAIATTTFKVELATNESELDAYGVEVPADYKTIDVDVVEPTIEAITLLLQSTGELDGWGIVAHWQPEYCSDCF